MKNQKKAVRILALVMAALLVLSLVVSVIPVRSHAEYTSESFTSVPEQENRTQFITFNS